MKLFKHLIVFAVPLFLAACGSNEFTGTYTDQMGFSKYTFTNKGELRVSTMAGDSVLSYDYDKAKQEIRIKVSDELPKQIIKVQEDGSLKAGAIELTRYPDTDILSGGAWITEKDTIIFSMALKKVSDQEMQAEINQLSLNPGDKTYSRQEGPGVTDNAVLEGRDLTLQEEGSTMRVTAISNDKMVLTFGQENMTFIRHEEGYLPIPEGYSEAK